MRKTKEEKRISSAFPRQVLLELPSSLVVLSPATTPNFDLVADVVNGTAPCYRSPKACKLRYDNVLLQREEGR